MRKGKKRRIVLSARVVAGRQRIRHGEGNRYGKGAIEKAFAAICAIALVFGIVSLSACTVSEAPSQSGSSLSRKASRHYPHQRYARLRYGCRADRFIPGVIGMAAVAQLKKDYEAQGYNVLCSTMAMRSRQRAC